MSGLKSIAEIHRYCIDKIKSRDTRFLEEKVGLNIHTTNSQQTALHIITYEEEKYLYQADIRSLE